MMAVLDAQVCHVSTRAIKEDMLKRKKIKKVFLSEGAHKLQVRVSNCQPGC